MKSIEPQVQLEVIRALYPNPVRVDEEKDGGYCVGGAWLAYHAVSPDSDEAPGFPCEDHLAYELQRAVNIPRHWALVYAHRITWANDHGRFARAWHHLGRALAGIEPHIDPRAHRVLQNNHLL